MPFAHRDYTRATRPTQNRALHATLGNVMNDPARNEQIDLALAVMCALQQPGEIVSCRTIAEVTGMSHGGAAWIEHNALRKIRRRLPLLRQLSGHLAA